MNTWLPTDGQWPVVQGQIRTGSGECIGGRCVAIDLSSHGPQPPRASFRHRLARGEAGEDRGGSQYRNLSTSVFWLRARLGTRTNLLAGLRVRFAGEWVVKCVWRRVMQIVVKPGSPLSFASW